MVKVGLIKRNYDIVQDILSFQVKVGVMVVLGLIGYRIDGIGEFLEVGSKKEKEKQDDVKVGQEFFCFVRIN